MAESTKIQILDAAEALFAEHGFVNTSLRSITATAGVNLASVNYHFGSKKLLIQAVLERYLENLFPEIEAQLGRLTQSRQAPTTYQVITALKQPLLHLNQLRPNGCSNFVQLLGRGYSESQGHLRKFIHGQYGRTLNMFIELIHKSLPDLHPSDIFWRMHFSIGSFVFTMASSKALSDIAEADYHLEVEIGDVIQRLLVYVSSGLSAPVDGRDTYKKSG